jgi:hypothetical protein
MVTGFPGLGLLRALFKGQTEETASQQQRPSSNTTTHQQVQRDLNRIQQGYERHIQGKPTSTVELTSSTPEAPNAPKDTLMLHYGKQMRLGYTKTLRRNGSTAYEELYTIDQRNGLVQVYKKASDGSPAEHYLIRIGKDGKEQVIKITADDNPSQQQILERMRQIYHDKYNNR